MAVESGAVSGAPDSRFCYSPVGHALGASEDTEDWNDDISPQDICHLEVALVNNHKIHVPSETFL